MAERAYGQYGRQLFLGESLDRDHITAVYHDGVLTLTVPLAESAKPHKIEVTHVGGVPRPSRQPPSPSEPGPGGTAPEAVTARPHTRPSPVPVPRL